MYVLLYVFGLSNDKPRGRPVARLIGVSPPSAIASAVGGPQGASDDRLAQASRGLAVNVL